MDLLLWITVGFVAIGFVDLAFITRNMKNKFHQSLATRSIVWRIVGTTIWGIVSIILIVWWFLDHFG
ncbi:hypothetical protein AN964_17695 [Heyndrickxia shackletonii]|uniref:Uncharacterized protein n=1 Tax=Heyndrickxia shackletonii TaxID=157838 RepID=A0A0Q3X0J7_9BACI|nr:hypothetical protein [Heyndrickxia shackletonii]KQL55162.1 hypothetical protein AN964_17695 [Heyndrickxia shackletonii]NEY98680.1 hypothetical protein [Heyndrickxia shackletonii]